MLKRLHPMRIGNMMFSEKLNPWMWPLKMFAPFIANARLPADGTNQFVVMEGDAGASITRTLDSYRKARDSASEQLFSCVACVARCLAECQKLRYISDIQERKS